MVKTDTLKVNSNVENVNIGLQTKDVFDLAINKFWYFIFSKFEWNHVYVRLMGLTYA